MKSWLYDQQGIGNSKFALHQAMKKLMRFVNTCCFCLGVQPTIQGMYTASNCVFVRQISVTNAGKKDSFSSTLVTVYLKYAKFEFAYFEHAYNFNIHIQL